MVMRYINEPIEEWDDDTFVSHLGYTRRPVIHGNVFD